MNPTTMVVIILCSAIGIVGLAALGRKIIQGARGDPAIWEGKIKRFTKDDEVNMPPSGSIVFTGSSSIRFWKTLEDDMAPLPVINRGFGGSQIYQVTHYAECIILPYKPWGVLLYAGENDIAGVLFSHKKSPDEVLEDFKIFCQVIHGEYNQIPIYFVSIKPPKRRRKAWPDMQSANKLIENYCQGDQRLHYIDILPGMFNADGSLRGELFKWDGIHLNNDGYRLWTEILRPILSRDFNS